jgi:hypothetical protein
MFWRTRILVVVTGGLLLAVAASPAAADLPGPDALGLYFDAEAGTTELELAEPATVDLYLILTRPTFGALEAWEAGLTLTGGATVDSVDFPVGCQPGLTGPADFSASFDTPLPCGVLTKLAVFHVQIAEGIDTMMFLGNVTSPTVPGDFPGARPAGQAWRSVDVASGDPGQPLASISLPTPAEDTLWGTVKLLFR